MEDGSIFSALAASQDQASGVREERVMRVMRGPPNHETRSCKVMTSGYGMLTIHELGQLGIPFFTKQYSMDFSGKLTNFRIFC